jgi:dynein heavy chain
MLQDGSAAKINPELVHKHFFVFALVWSVGASCDLVGREKFNEFLRSLLEENGHAGLLPASGSVYGSSLLSTFHEWQWKDWLETMGPFKLDPKTPFGSILVPTTDTIRYSHLVALFVNNGKHLLAVGNTGTGKVLRY